MARQQQARSRLDDSPMAALYEREALAIFTYVLRRVPSREDAEDILLEIFLAALENEAIGSLDAEKQRAWLLRVAHNKVVDFHRYAARRNNVPLEDVAETLYGAEDMEPDQVMLRQEEYALLQANLGRLPTLQQEIVRLRYNDELPYQEIAARVQKREGAIRVLLSRSFHFLRNIYKQQEGGHDNP
ncbi:MAG TPA: RNA polymerase sigma factor [Ktedonobacteraceae bacterium]|nr:RNA polymerase sigma factor [Ktedonobacteraceae bacterium]